MLSRLLGVSILAGNDSVKNEFGHIAHTLNSYNINLTPIWSTYRVLFELKNNYQIDLRVGNFADFIGFDKKLVTQTEYGSKLPNITSLIDTLNINCDAITDSLVDGENSNSIAVIPTDNLKRGYPFTKEQQRVLFNPVSNLKISKMTFTVTDSLGREVDLNGVDWYIVLILRSTSI